jgi:hypothetical protein
MNHLYTCLGWIGLATVAAAQTSAGTSACNNLARVLLIAGGTSENTISCTPWSLAVNIPGIASASLSGPSACVTSRVIRTGDTFGCSGTAVGIHCRTDGDSVQIKTAVNSNPCPGIPLTLPTTAAEARAATSCGALGPEIVETNYSASIKNCLTSIEDPQRADGEVVAEGSGNFHVRLGDPTSMLAPPVPNEAFLTLDALQTETAANLPLVLQQALQSYPSVHGFAGLLATVVYSFATPGSETPIVNRRRIEGTVLADQRFAIAKTYRSETTDGEGIIVTEDVVYDGATLFSHVRGNSTGNAWASTSSHTMSLRQSEGHAALMLADWAYQPFWITRFPGTQRVVESAPGNPMVTVTESYPGFAGPGQSLGTTVYFIDTTDGAKPVAILTKDLDGSVVLRRDFGDHRLVAPGIWRPFSVCESRYQTGASEPWVVIEMNVQQATLLESSASTSFGRPVLANEAWFVRP